jgi:hypothetical protein
MLATSPLIEVREATAPVGDTNRGSQLLLSIMLKYSDLVIVILQLNLLACCLSSCVDNLDRC